MALLTDTCFMDEDTRRKMLGDGGSCADDDDDETLSVTRRRAAVTFVCEGYLRDFRRDMSAFPEKVATPQRLEEAEEHELVSRWRTAAAQTSEDDPEYGELLRELLAHVRGVVFDRVREFRDLGPLIVARQRPNASDEERRAAEEDLNRLMAAATGVFAAPHRSREHVSAVCAQAAPRR